MSFSLRIFNYVVNVIGFNYVILIETSVSYDNTFSASVQG
jgi:hypothetical protein